MRDTYKFSIGTYRGDFNTCGATVARQDQMHPRLSRGGTTTRANIDAHGLARKKEMLAGGRRGPPLQAPFAHPCG